MNPITPLSPDVLADALAALPDWEIPLAATPQQIQRTLAFRDFVAAMAFVNRVADLAEARNHHPGIQIDYNRVTLTLYSHDAGGLTQRDIDFAQALEEILATP